MKKVRVITEPNLSSNLPVNDNDEWGRDQFVDNYYTNRTKVRVYPSPPPTTEKHLGQITKRIGFVIYV